MSASPSCSGVVTPGTYRPPTRAAGPRRLLDHLLTPANRLASCRFLAESLAKVWENVLALHEARLGGAELHRTRLAELEVLAAAKVADLLRPV